MHLQLLFCFATLLYVLALFVLLWVTRHKRKFYTLAKGSVSLLFVLAALFAFWLAGRPVSANFVLLLTALLLCMGGDVLLGLANRTKTVCAKPFAGGAISFLLAHIFFCVLFYREVAFQWYDVLAPILLVGVLLTLNQKGWVRLKHMLALGVGYTFVVGLMAVKSLQVAVGPYASFPIAAVLLAGGGMLFLCSDIILLFLYFGKRRRKGMRYANLSTYYIGIYSIAVTAYWM